MPLSETAQKYAEAVFTNKYQELSSDYESKIVTAKRGIGDVEFANHGKLQAHLEALKAEMLANQVRAKADALVAAYQKDGKLLDDGVLAEIMKEVECYAQSASAGRLGAAQFQAQLQAQRTRHMDASASARAAELNRSMGVLMNRTLSDIRSALQTKI